MRTDGSPGAGQNMSQKVVVPPLAATGVDGWAITPKSEALLPVNWTGWVPDRFKTPFPVLVMVKTLGDEPMAGKAVPKSVPLAALGDWSPLGIAVPP